MASEILYRGTVQKNMEGLEFVNIFASAGKASFKLGINVRCEPVAVPSPNWKVLRLGSLAGSQSFA